MSIVTSYVLRELYNAANADKAQETETMAFWNHYFNKHMFIGDEWVVSPEYPPSSHIKDRKRRCDAVVKYFSTVLMRLILVANIEGKRSGGSMTDVEAQLVEACESSSKDPSSPCPFGIAIIGTYMKIFQRVNSEWRDILPSYIDADDSASAHLITQGLQLIKQSVPQASSRQTQQPGSGVKYSSMTMYGHPLSTPTSSSASAGAVTTPQQSSLKLIGSYDRGVKIEYNGKQMKMSRDYFYIRELGYYQVDKQRPALVRLSGPPENVGISFPYEQGKPYRMLKGGKWVTLDP